jgi:hypothetical protein
MKRDLNLYREILVKLETGPPLADGGWPRLDLPDRTEAEISYHAGLMHSEGLIDALDVTNASTPAGQYDWKATGLTPQGHAFLEKIRDEKVWKAVLAKVGGASATIALSIIEEHAREYVKKLGAGL